MSEKVWLLPHVPGEPEQVLKFSDGRVVTCFHDGTPCNGCKVPREDWPAVWEPSFWKLVDES